MAEPLDSACLWPRAVLYAVRKRPGLAPPPVDILVHKGAHVRAATAGVLELDITHCQSHLGPPDRVARRYRQQLPARERGAWAIGVAGNGHVARLAAHRAGAGECLSIPPWETAARLRGATLTELWPADLRTLARLRLAGIRTCGEVACRPMEELVALCGRSGRALWHLCRGADPDATREALMPRQRLDVEQVLPPRTATVRTLRRYLRHLCRRLDTRLREQDLIAGKLEVSLAYDRAGKRERDIFDLPVGAHGKDTLYTATEQLLRTRWGQRPITCIGLAATGLQAPGGQLDLFN